MIQIPNQVNSEHRTKAPCRLIELIGATADHGFMMDGIEHTYSEMNLFHW